MALTADFITGKPLAFSRMRRLLETLEGAQEGVVGAGDLKVAQRAAGANMSVDVAAGDANVKIDTGTRNGLAHVLNDAVVNAVVGAAHATLPRIDLVVLQYNDTAIPAGVGGDLPTVRVIAGAATGGATQDNPLGVAALPNDALRIAHVLVPAASVTVVTANIRDRRTWANGAYRKITRVANAAAANDYTTASTSMASLDATNARPRIECSGATMRLTLRGRLSHNTIGGIIYGAPWQDGTVPENTAGDWFSWQRDTNISEAAVVWSYEWQPAAGSHLLEVAWRTGSGVASLVARAAAPVQLIAEEILRPSADNT